MSNSETAPMPAVCIVGCASWDTLFPVDRYPAEGEYCIIAERLEQPGGTSTNFAVALARLGLPPRFVGVIGDDWRGVKLREGLEREGVICDTVSARRGQESDHSYVTIGPTGDRTIFWLKGAMLRRGDAVNTDLVYAHRLVYLDIVDLDLWGDLLDTFERDHAGRTDAPLLVGQAVYVAGILPPAAAMAHVRRHHVFIGGVWEWQLLTGEKDDAAMLAAIGAAMHGAPFRAALVTRGAAGCTLVQPDLVRDFPAFPVNALDTTGAGDAFAAGFAYRILTKRSIRHAAVFANAVGGLATRGVGAQTSLPTRNEVEALMNGNPSVSFLSQEG